MLLLCLGQTQHNRPVTIFLPTRQRPFSSNYFRLLDFFSVIRLSCRGQKKQTAGKKTVPELPAARRVLAQRPWLYDTYTYRRSFIFSGVFRWRLIKPTWKTPDLLWCNFALHHGNCFFSYIPYGAWASSLSYWESTGVRWMGQFKSGFRSCCGLNHKEAILFFVQYGSCVMSFLWPRYKLETPFDIYLIVTQRT